MRPRGAVVDPHRDQTGPTPIIGTLSSWVRLHEEEGPFADCADYSVGGMLDYLRARNVLAWAVLQPWADEYAAEIGDTHRALQPYALLRARRKLLQLPCPRCHLLTLTVEDGKDAECGNPGCQILLRLLPRSTTTSSGTCWSWTRWRDATLGRPAIAGRPSCRSPPPLGPCAGSPLGHLPETWRVDVLPHLDRSVLIVERGV